MNLDTLHLAPGGHSDPDDGLCLLEAVALFSGEPHTDRPACVSRLLGDFGRSLNDCLPDDKRQLLKPLIPSLPGTVGDGLEGARAYLALDWLVRTYAYAWLDLAGLTAEAAQLRALPRIAGQAAARAAGPVVKAAAAKAAQLRASASAATSGSRDSIALDVAAVSARAAAEGAAISATWDCDWAIGLTRDVAREAALDAAWAVAASAPTAASAAELGRLAATSVAVTAAASEVTAALAPTVAVLQDSAIDLYARMVHAAH